MEILNYIIHLIELFVESLVYNLNFWTILYAFIVVANGGQKILSTAIVCGIFWFIYHTIIMYTGEFSIFSIPYNGHILVFLVIIFCLTLLVANYKSYLVRGYKKAKRHYKPLLICVASAIIIYLLLEFIVPLIIPYIFNFVTIIVCVLTLIYIAYLIKNKLKELWKDLTA